MNARWTLIGLLATALFFVAIGLVALAARYRHSKSLVCTALLLALSYTVQQSVSTYASGGILTPGKAAFVAFFTAGNGLFLLALCLLVAAAEWLMLRFDRRYAAKRITPSSIKEAMDSLPSGLCFYRDDGRVLLVNRAMETLCRRLTGEALVNCGAFYESLRLGTLPPDCLRAEEGETPLILLPDGAAWSFSNRRLQNERMRANLLVASDVTEIYSKTRALKQAREKVTALNRRLTDYNREIVALTTAREILNAKVKIHDELGANLLAIHRYLTDGGTQEDREDIAARLQLNVSFLKSRQTQAVRNEYTLMLETARTLGVDVRVEGDVPDWEPARHILSVAIHECFTNTLRHAHGSALQVRICTSGDCLEAEFTNDGEQPRGPIRERGGLHSLRTLVEQAGGKMTVRTTPVFSIVLNLPKEEDYGLSSDDRG